MKKKHIARAFLIGTWLTWAIFFIYIKSYYYLYLLVFSTWIGALFTAAIYSSDDTVIYSNHGKPSR